MEHNYVKLFLDDIKRLWGNLGIPQKIGLVLLILATLIIATIFLIKSTEPNWSVLYSDLTEQDTAAIAQSLRKSGYPFKLSQDKRAILVPAEFQDDLRLYIAEHDLIKDSSPGFELLDDLQLGSTDFKNRLTKQRIFQGELTKTIERLNGIKKARVQIAEPERSIFTDKDEIPSASVMLILEPGYVIKTTQVKAIKNLVAYSIPRLTPDRVFLTDQSGNSLSDEIQKNSTEIESYRINLEKQTAKKIQEVLDKITGIGNSSVQVSAEIDFNTVRATIESYLPSSNNSGVLASSQSETEVYQKPTPEGFLETTEETATAQETNGDKNINYEKQRTATNYNVSKEIKQVIYAPGSIKRMTIGVAVNKILTPSEKEELKNLVSSVSGVSLERGDVVNISSIEFASNDEVVAEQKKVMKSIEIQNQLEFWANKVISPFIFLVLGITALFILRSVMQNYKPTEEEAVEEETINLKEELDNFVDIEPLLQLEAKVDPEMDKMKSNLAETIMADPEEATELLMNYINYVES